MGGRAVRGQGWGESGEMVGQRGKFVARLADVLSVCCQVSVEVG